MINAHADLKGIWAITSVSLPGAAKAVRDAGKADQIFVTGLSLPNTMRRVRRGRHGQEVRALEPGRPGLSDRARGQAAARGEAGRRASKRSAGCTDIRVTPGEVLLGPPKVFDRENIGQYDF